VSVADLQDADVAELWEGVLVSVQDVTVTDADPGYGEWLVDGVLVDDYIYDALQTGVEVGGTFEAVSGPLHFTFGQFKILPRDEDDLVGYTPP
jgi:hypothetical protein